mgnify:CR=1 FL=1|tara:strand:- start:654 stop:1130 length:477 start_codon:yes stop_codon:yes gene_type:complete
MEVIDNFLPLDEFKSLESIMMGDKFPWYYNDAICYQGDNLFQFVNCFYNINGIDNGLFHLIEPYLHNFVIKKLYRIKANRRPRSSFNRKSFYHIDYPNMSTAILYINTNNGYTKFKKGGKVKSVSNRVVIFDSNLEHAGFTCSDEKTRVVINFNYEAN